MKKKLKEHSLDALLITSIPNIIYLTGFSNFLSERETFLLVTKNKQFIFTNSLYIEEVEKMNLGFEIIQITRENPFKKALQKLGKRLKIKKLGVEEKNLTVEEFNNISQYYNNIYYHSETVDSLRIIKEPEEIKFIGQACKIGDEVFNHILKKIKPGVTEKELAFELEIFVKKQGFELSFPSIVAFGPHASVPHHQTNDQRLTTNCPILLDFGVKVNNYCSDMTRTVFFGKATQEQEKMYQTVLAAQQKAFEYLRLYSSSERSESRSLQKNSSRLRSNNIKSSYVDKVARDYIISQGYPSIPHSLGHGIGLEVHESPRLSPVSKDQLKPGMVFSIEPGIYIPGLGGVRIEDLVALEQKGPRYLTHSPKHLIEI